MEKYELKDVHDQCMRTEMAAEHLPYKGTPENLVQKSIHIAYSRCKGGLAVAEARGRVWTQVR